MLLWTQDDKAIYYISDRCLLGNQFSLRFERQKKEIEEKEWERNSTFTKERKQSYILYTLIRHIQISIIMLMCAAKIRVYACVDF